MPISVKRSSLVLHPDQTRVLLRHFNPGNAERVASIVTRIQALPEESVGGILAQVMAEFSLRHGNLNELLEERFEQVRAFAQLTGDYSRQRQLLIGSYFLAEYSLESAALFNPSMIPHPDQTDLPVGALRFILSLRSTGEGHISSISFREGVVDAEGGIRILPASGFLSEPRQIPDPQYEKPLFMRRLMELGLTCEYSHNVMNRVGAEFTLEDLRAALAAENARLATTLTPADPPFGQGIWLLARSNHQVRFRPEQDLSARVLFPATASQRNGIEDARFTRFLDDDGRVDYYATFTAYDGATIAPEFLETTDFLCFRFVTLNGPAAQNKGMALFPRKIRGRYAMLSRQDNECIYLMYSENVHFWNERQPLLAPLFPWELVQIGNCGSPIETKAGWLVLSHGVGPMRTYTIGAFLLDLEDPAKVVGRLREPLLIPNSREREGYVPNVVYSCGALVHHGELIIPYGLADHATSFATVNLDALLEAMQAEGA